MPIKEGRSGLFYNAKTFTLTDDSSSFGDVHFRPRKLFRPAELCLVQTEPYSGIGNGRELLHAFIEEVGRGPITTTEISHSETWTVFRELGLLRAAYIQGMFTVSDRQLLSEVIPITRFLERGGIHVLRIVIEYGKKKRLPTYEDIGTQYDKGSDHFISYFGTRIDGEIE